MSNSAPLGSAGRLGSTSLGGFESGAGIGALIMSVFGFTWLGWGFSADSAFTPVEWVVLYIFAGALVWACAHAIRRDKSRAGERDEFWAKTGKQFTRLNIAQGVLCGIVVFFAVVGNRLDLLPLGISLVVGVHFLPLAAILRVPAYYATGIAIVAGDALCWTIFRSAALVMSVGVATGGILWLTAAYALFRAAQARRGEVSG
ncbi:MAG: hypothetical protein ACYC96_02755 [Fimbriimonadaceae bacterium]